MFILRRHCLSELQPLLLSEAEKCTGESTTRRFLPALPKTLFQSLSALSVRGSSEAMMSRSDAPGAAAAAAGGAASALSSDYIFYNIPQSFQVSEVCTGVPVHYTGTIQYPVWILVHTTVQYIH